jgi:hypothetical protein
MVRWRRMQQLGHLGSGEGQMQHGSSCTANGYVESEMHIRLKLTDGRGEGPLRTDFAE